MIYDIQMKKPDSETSYNLIVQSSFIANDSSNTFSSDNRNRKKHKRKKSDYYNIYDCLMM